ncbi:Imm26 family immunity protein [Winogradskyella sp.]|uniref:Imm26 family immunity protein n=1 Tax=Winogradskyella sp. TaxID=1883156 RepID=UPI00260F3E16|nr:Imm26 family immunity protein [Winogradskyella sp.]
MKSENHYGRHIKLKYHQHNSTMSKIKKGDVFEVKLGEEEVGFFQYLLLDPAQLNSEVIRIFSYRSKERDNYDLNQIVNSEIDFFAHVVIPFGFTTKLWKKIGNVDLESDLERPLFRAVFGEKREFKGNRIIYKKTDQWQVWRAGDSFDSRRPLGWITEGNKDIDLGMVKAPNEIVHRMKTGEYSYSYYT